MKRLFHLFKGWLELNGVDLLPVRQAILKYNIEKLKGDVRAGCNVALLTFPQAVAYAIIAGLPIDCGVYGATIATIAAAFFSGSHFVNFGPTNATAVLLMSSFATLSIPPEKMTLYLPILLVLTGIFLILGAFLNIANLVQYISRSVIFGYVTAIVVLMVAHQIHNLFGFPLDLTPNTPVTFFDVCLSTIKGLPSLHWDALFFSCLTLVLYLILKRYLPHWPFVAVTIILVSVISYLCNQFLPLSLQFLSPVDAGQWKFSWHGFNFEHLSLMADTALALSFLCLLDGTTISKSMAARLGQKPNVNQVVYGLGVANIFCGILSGMPASGSLVRSAVNYNSGAKSPVAGIFSGLLCLCGIIFLGPFFQYIPQAGLAMLIVLLALSLFNKHAIRIIVTATRSDALVFTMTFLAGLLFPLNSAIYMGIFLSIALFLRKAAVPEFHEYTFNDSEVLSEVTGQEQNLQEHPEISIVHIEGNLFFAASDLFRDQIRQVCERPALQVIILKMRNALHIDATCIMALEELVRYMQMKHRVLILSEAKAGALKSLKNSGLIHLIGIENIFADNRKNPNLSTAKALKRAKSIIGQPRLQIRILTKDIRNEPSYGQRIKTSLRTLVAPIQDRFHRNVK